MPTLRHTSTLHPEVEYGTLHPEYDYHYSHTVKIIPISHSHKWSSVVHTTTTTTSTMITTTPVRFPAQNIIALVEPTHSPNHFDGATMTSDIFAENGAIMNKPHSGPHHSPIHRVIDQLIHSYEHKTFEPIFVSLAYYLYVFGLCELGRRMVDRYIKYNYELKYLLIEFLGTLQICCMLYENQFVAKYYGLNAYTFTLFVLILLHCYTLGTAVGNACPLFEYYLNRVSTPLVFTAYLAMQLLASYIAYRIAWLFWNVGLSFDHQASAFQYVCYSPLQVNPFLGVFCEMTGMFTTRMVLLTSIELFPRFWKPILSLCWALVVRIGLDLTGFYMNPVLAASNIHGCIGLADWHHVLVYWLGPIVGWILASIAFGYCKSGLPARYFSSLRRICATRCKRRGARTSSRTPTSDLAYDMTDQGELETLVS